MSPQFIRTADDFNRAVRLGQTTESLTLEFKREIDRWRAPTPDERRKGQLEFCRDLTQFANTIGGCLLIGVGEHETGGQRVATTIAGVRDFDRQREWMEQAVRNCVVPSTMSLEICSVSLGAETVIAVNIPAQPHLVWVWESDTAAMQCFRRTNHGKQAMNPDEAERHLMDGSRAKKLAFLDVQTRCNDGQVELVSGLWQYFRQMGANYETSEGYRPVPCRASVRTPGEREFTLYVSFESTSRVVNVPYGLIRECWLTEIGSMGLLLSARLVLEPQRIGMLPF